MGFDEMGAVFTLVHVEVGIMSYLAKDIASGVGTPGELALIPLVP